MKNVHPDISEANRLGISYEERIRIIADISGAGAIGDMETWLDARMETHRNPGEPNEWNPFGDITWLFNKQRLADGSIANIGYDISR